jgi:3'-phosphoadenosine 5'-phosphosulfate sulfotransferase (PAPS reductase)/FAD synthetase
MSRYIQLELFPPSQEEPQTRLDNLINWSFEVFDKLFDRWIETIDGAIALFNDLTSWLTDDLDIFFIRYGEPLLGYLLAWFDKFYQKLKSYWFYIAFSGGKDSHVLLGVYLDWCRSRGKSLPVRVVFSDTFLESNRLYDLVDSAAEMCKRLGIPFIKVQPPTEQTFWIKLMLGYPVPNHMARWCTKYLKTDPMKKTGGIPMAGSHAGESSKRDRRLNSCGSTDCGIDQIENKIEAIAPWANCDVWDYLILKADTSLYVGASEKLMGLYDIAENEKGSLRMGCFMCPVVVKKRIEKQVEDGIIPEFSIPVRELIEELRVAPRILSPKTGKAGATLFEARRAFWNKLQPYIPLLQEYGWITNEIVQIIEEMMERRAYPPTYKKEWVEQQEPLAISWSK